MRPRPAQIALLVAPIAFVLVVLRLVQQHGRALQAAELDKGELELRVRESTEELERNFRQMAELRVEQVTERERKSIGADLHDDLGAKLLTIVHTSDSERISTLARGAGRDAPVGARPPIEVMTDWARRDSHGSTDPVTWARRLKRLRTFVRWLQQFEPDTEVPDDTVFGRMPERKAPHIYSEQEIIDLLASARRFGPASSLRGVIFETLFGLIASTGLRISEALSLKNADVDLKTGMLNIRLAKFGKSRQCLCIPVRSAPCGGIARGVTWRVSRATTTQRSLLEAGGGCMACHWVTARCIASSASCASNWAGPTAARTMPHASMI